MAKSKKNKKKAAVQNSQKKAGKIVDLKSARAGKNNVRKSQGR